MADVFYVRNGRPNRLILKHAGLKILLERRGSREDTASLPVDAEHDPLIARFLRTGYLEKISKDAFMTLMGRDSDTTYPVKAVRANEVAIPMENEQSRTPTIIAEEHLADASTRTPRLDFENYESTDIELGFEKRPPSPELEAANERERELLERIAALEAKLESDDAVEEKPKAAPRKRATSGTKRTRAKNS